MSLPILFQIDGESGGINLGIGELLTLLPRLIVAAFILVAAIAVGRWLGGKAATVARRMELGDAIVETPLGVLFDRPAAAEETVGQLLRYLIYVVGITMAASMAGFNQLADLLYRLSTYVPSVLGAVLIVLVGFVVAGYVGRSVCGSDVVGDRAFTPVLASGVKTVIYFVVVTLALDALGYSTAILNTLAEGVALGVGLGIALAIGIGVGIGSQDYVADHIDEWTE